MSIKYDKGEFNSSGPNHRRGLVPDPGATPMDPADPRYLREDGDFETLPAPAAETDPIFDAWVAGAGDIYTYDAADFLDSATAGDIYTHDASEFEPALGNPAVTGYILSSTDVGVRSWIVAPAGGMANPMTTLGDIIYGKAAGAPERLAGALEIGKSAILTSTAIAGPTAQAPVWSAYFLAGTATKTYTFPVIDDTLAGLGTANVFTATQSCVYSNAAAAVQVYAKNTSNTGYGAVVSQNSQADYMGVECYGSAYAADTTLRNFGVLEVGGATYAGMYFLLGVNKPFKWRINGVEVMDIASSAGKLALPVTGSGAGLSLGTATAFTLYQDASDSGTTPNNLKVLKNVALGGANTYTYLSFQHNSATSKAYMQMTGNTGFSLNSNAYYGGATWNRGDIAVGASVLQCNGDGTTYNFWWRWGAAGANPLTLTSLMHLDSTGLLSLDVTGSGGGISCGTATACTLYQSASDTWYTPNSMQINKCLGIGTGITSTIGLDLLNASQGIRATVNDNTNNTNPYILDLRHFVTTPTAPTTGFGGRFRIVLHSAARTGRQAATWEAMWTDATDGAEISKTILSGMSAGATSYAFVMLGTATTNAYNFAFVQANASPNFQGMRGGAYWGDNTTEPANPPASGIFAYSRTGHMKVYEHDNLYFPGMFINATKTVAAAPYANDGYITVYIGGTAVKLMTTA